MTSRVKHHIINNPEQSLFIRGIRHWVGFQQLGLEYERDARFAGETKYTFGKLLKLAYNGIFSFSDFPIKLLGRIGIYTILFTIIYAGYLLSKRLIWGTMPQGYTSLILTVLFFGGVQLISIRILGEYTTRIYDEARNRPLYIIQNTYL